MGKSRDNIIFQIIDRFKEKKILLVGDTILDIYVYGTAIGKSLETPTIVASEQETKMSFGGASLVAQNMLELGSKVFFVSVLGNDKEAENYKNFVHKNLEKNFVSDDSRKTTIKKRFWIDGYKLLQIDNLDNRDIDRSVFTKISNAIEKKIKQVDIVVVSDYRHGLMTKELIGFVKNICKKNNKKLFVDSQISHRESSHENYKDVFIVFLSEKEAKAIDPNFKPNTSVTSFSGLKKKLRSANICVKLGKKGSLALIGNKVIQTNAITVEPKDVCGAGDAFLAAFALSDLNQADESLKIANTWAGLSTLIHGTTPPKKQDLLNYFKGEN